MKRSRIGLAGLGVLALVGAGTWFVSRPRVSDEEQITNMIIEIKRAVETKNAGDVLKYIATDYNDGSYTRREITQLVVAGFRGPEEFRVDVSRPTIRVDGNEAEAQASARFTTGAARDGSGSMDLQVVARMKKQRGGWKVVSATGWEPAMQAGE